MPRTLESPVLDPEQARALGQKILGMASGDTVSAQVQHTARQITRIANGQVLGGDDGDELRLTVQTEYGLKGDVSIVTNQIDDTFLRAAVVRAESVARAMPGSPYNLLRIPRGRQDYLPVTLWHEPSVTAISERPPVAAAMIDVARAAGVVAAGFVGFMARSAMIVNKDGLESYYRETDCECTMTARLSDGTAAGWHGQADRDWSKIDPHAVASAAIDMAKRGAKPKALEPGRRTAILGPFAVVQLIHTMTKAFDAFMTDNGNTAFSKHPTGSKLGFQLFDRRVMLSSDPNDADGGYRPDFSGGLPEPKMTWVENGVLTNLAYPSWYGVQQGKPYAGLPWSMRMAGGPTTVDAMIASCDEGVYVNRFAGIERVNVYSGMLTGVTADGCFNVKHGKIDTPIKNYRFMDSPWFFLNQILAIGPTVRAAFGYTPPGSFEGEREETEWPRRPMIVPPLMVKDFNFTALADAV
jgi:predicted Zn-dependent protease